MFGNDVKWYYFQNTLAIFAVAIYKLYGNDIID